MSAQTSLPAALRPVAAQHQDVPARETRSRGQRTPWRPLLDGDDAAAARESVWGIATILAQRNARAARLPGLACGSAGIALFFSYLAQATESDAVRASGHEALPEHWADIASAYLDDMLGPSPHEGAWPSLYSGFTGIAWTLEHLQGRLFEDDGDAAAGSDVDDVLAELLAGPIWPGEYELVNGLVGIGLYALESWPRASARHCLGLVLDQLERRAQKRPDGLTWHTDPRSLPDHQRRRFPNGYDNLGMAHGVPAVIVFLATLCHADIERSRAQRLLAPAIGWLLAQECGPELGTCFPHAVAAGSTPTASRLAWCYGDPGVAIALLQAGCLTGQGDWQREGERIAISAATRAMAMSGVEDAGFCHGSAGLGHLFARMHQLTGNDVLAEAARRWYRHTLAQRRPEEGLAGYLADATPDAQEGSWRKAHGLLEGVAGIGLALLAAISPLEPAWDRVFMTSTRRLPGRDRSAR